MAKSNGRIHTPVGIAAYVQLHTPKARVDKKGNPQGDPKYGLAMFFSEDTDISELTDAAFAIALEKCGGDKVGAARKAHVQRLIDNKKIGWPFQDTADMDEPSEPFDQPGVSINFKTTEKPGIVDMDAEPIMEKSEIYSGMEARVSCRPFWYDNESKGVSFYLVNVQKTGDGKRMSGNPSAEDDFADAKAKSKKPAAKSKVKRRDDDEDLDDLL